MVLLDSDVLIDLLRGCAPALAWFNALPQDEELLVPGYVVMEVIQGCRNRAEQERVERSLAGYGVVWLSPADCDKALRVFAEYRLSRQAGILDVLIGQIAVSLDVALCTFNQKHYAFIAGLQTSQPYARAS